MVFETFDTREGRANWTREGRANGTGEGSRLLIEYWNPILPNAAGGALPPK
ncbi:unnamed protein product [Prunus armeniaca]|uniref:Uncharacterized protein n=1 Tax=Prunus armeniaca TaxID=36596 RepID=A0A6J5U2N5_PRUAR|nr:unnamed protein product [Prunus armeniaca]CAB4300064.1 unnamed protein product [Prunus armeniaca]